MSGFSFDSSAVRAYTGSTGPAGKNPSGNVGATGSAGPVGTTGFRGITGTSGPSIIGTFFETDPKEENFGYHVIQFSDYAGNIATASPKGLTGRPGPVIGGTAHFANTGGGKTGIFVDHGPYGVTFGTGLLGVSGATLTFKRISGSGDISFYTNHALGIGTGATHAMIGLTGPKVHGYGGITSNSIGELAYLADVKNVKDAHGLTFTTVGVTAGAGANGLTFGTVTAKFVNHSEHFHIHGNSITGVETNPFYIYTNTGNVHLLYPPFNLRGITLDFHSSRSPISYAPTWVGTKGTTADYGEAVSVTLIIDGGPRGIQFGDGFYFPKNGITFTQGRDIINCLSYDHGSSWFLSPAGFGFGITGPIEDQSDIGCCYNDSLQTCNDYITRSECENFGDGYVFVESASCETTYVTPQEEENVNLIWGSCCVNKDPNNQSQEAVCIGGTTAGNTAEWMTQDKCEKFGGLFRRFVPCDFPCGDPCDENFGTLGACCQFDLSGNYIACDQYTAFECNNVSIPGVASTTYAGDNTFCEQISCCKDELNYGACCMGDDSCIDNLTPIECASPVFNGIYMGHDSRCDRVSCVCEEPQPAKSVCIACYAAAGGVGCGCCNQQTFGSCVNYQGMGGDGSAVGINFWAEGIACEDMILEPSEDEYPLWNLVASYEAGLVNICGNPAGVPNSNEQNNCIELEYANNQPFYHGGYCCYTRRPKGMNLPYEVICGDADFQGPFGDVDGQAISEQNCICLQNNGEDCGFLDGFNEDWEYKDSRWNGSGCHCPDPSPCLPVDNDPFSDTFGMFMETPLSGGGDGGDERNMNIPAQELGSCCVYPIKDSCVDELEFSCFNVNAAICNQVANDLNRMYGERAYGTTFNLGKCCCDSESCGGSSNSSSNNIGMGFNECMVAIHGAAALECPGRFRDPSCNFLPAYVYHRNCSATTSTNTIDGSAFVVESECGNRYCSPSGAAIDDCSNCPVDSFEAAGACCCTDYVNDGFDSCPACSSCTYTTKEECINKQFEFNSCPDPTGNGGSYPCNCQFYPETTCGELAQDGICDAASEELSDLEHTPLVIPKTHSRVSPKIVQSVDKLKAVPRSREQLSGVLCSDNSCELIHDIHDYMVKNGSWPSMINQDGEYQVFLPHVPEIYTRLSKYGRIPTPVNETAKEQFIKAITTGGRTNRALSIDEMVNLYSRNSTKLNKNHFNAMKMAYAVEKTITQSDPAGSYRWFTGNSDLNSYCACGDFEYDEIKIVKTKIQFPMISSPYGNSCIEINVPAGTENYIATKLGGIATTSCSDNTNKLYQFRSVIGKEKTILNKKTMSMTENMVHCVLPDGTRLRCSEDYCKDALGGTSTGIVKNLHNSHDYRKHSHERRSYNFRKKE